MITKEELFVNSYIETALWTLTDENEEPCDWASHDDIECETLKHLVGDAASFYEAHQEYFTSEENSAKGGQDFWLTRNGHGAGFWDGGWEDEVGYELSSAAKVYGGHDLYLGEDDIIHGLGS